MGYILGKFQRLSGPPSDEEFRRLRQQGAYQLGVEGGTVVPVQQMEVPILKPQQAMFIRRQQAVNATQRYAAGSLDVTHAAPLFNDPRYTSSTLAIPTDERTLHGLYRFYNDTDPIVGNAIRLHTELPMAELSLGPAPDSGVDSHFQEMWSRINGYMTVMDAVSEYWMIGECTLFGAWNETDLMWDQFAILNPDYVKKESTWIAKNPLIRLVPDEALKKIVRTQSPYYLYEQLPEEIKAYVLRGQDIPLEPNNTFTISHAKSSYEVRGRSVIKRVLKTLMYEDRLQQAQFAIAGRHVVPLTVVKLGDPTTGWVPNQEEIDNFREMLAAWELDPSFAVLYHWGIDVQFYGSTGKVLPLGGEFDRVYKLKFIGLGVSEAMLSGAGATYATAFASLEVQRQRYLSLQLRLNHLVHDGWFKPVADVCGFYKTSKLMSGRGGVGKAYGTPDTRRRDFEQQFTMLRDFQDNIEFQQMLMVKEEEWSREARQLQKQYITPQLDWGSLSMASDDAYKNMLLKIKDKFPHLVDDDTIVRVMKLDPKRMADGFIRDKLKEALRNQQVAQLLSRLNLPSADVKKKPGGDGGEFEGGGVDLGALEPTITGPEAPVGASEMPTPSAEGVAPAEEQTAPVAAASAVDRDLARYSAEEQEMLRASLEEDFQRESAVAKTLLKDDGLTEEEINRIVFRGNGNG